MCEPTTILAATSFAMSAAGSVYQHNATRSAANTQRDALLASQRENDVAMQWQALQQDQQASQQLSERAKQALAEKGRLEAAMASTGLSGNSFGRMSGEVDLNASTDLATILANRDNQAFTGSLHRRGATMGTNNALASIQQPSLLGTGLRIGQAALDSYGMYAGSRAGSAKKLAVPTNVPTGWVSQG